MEIGMTVSQTLSCQKRGSASIELFIVVCFTHLVGDFEVVAILSVSFHLLGTVSMCREIGSLWRHA